MRDFRFQPWPGVWLRFSPCCTTWLQCWDSIFRMRILPSRFFLIHRVAFHHFITCLLTLWADMLLRSYLSPNLRINFPTLLRIFVAAFVWTFSSSLSWVHIHFFSVGSLFVGLRVLSVAHIASCVLLNARIIRRYLLEKYIDGMIRGVVWGRVLSRRSSGGTLENHDKGLVRLYL